MPNTVVSSLWLSLVDMLVVFAVLAFLMFICYGLKFFSRGMAVEGADGEGGESPVDVAAGDEPASESPMLQNVSRPADIHERPGEMFTVPEGAPSVSADVSRGVQSSAQSAGLRAFRITVQGRAFDVEIDQSEDGQSAVQSLSQVAVVAPAIPAPADAPASAERPMAAPPSAPAVSPSSPSARIADASNLMKSPLPGKVLKVVAAPGKSFNKGDTLMIIEAMKMENEILAPRDCVVAEVSVGVNQSVKTGDPLLRME